MGVELNKKSKRFLVEKSKSFFLLWMKSDNFGGGQSYSNVSVNYAGIEVFLYGGT
jgi:hypothetical protein